jgi:hypothetical protein
MLGCFAVLRRWRRRGCAQPADKDKASARRQHRGLMRLSSERGAVSAVSGPLSGPACCPNHDGLLTMADTVRQEAHRPMAVEDLSPQLGRREPSVLLGMGGKCRMAEPLTVLDKTPQAIRSTPHGSQVGELLAVYQGVLDSVDDLPLVPMVLRKHRGRLHYRPRTKWPVRYFVLRHVGRTLASLSRRYSARAALGQQADGEQQDREAVREFQQSLPPDRQKIYVLLLIAAIFIVLGFVMPLVVDSFDTKAQGNSVAQQLEDVSTRSVGALTGARAMNGTSTNNAENEDQQVEDTSMKILGAITDPRTINDAVNAVLRSGPLVWCLLTLGMMLSAYVALRLLMPAFRLKRMIFNLAPEPEGRHRSAVARWSVSQPTGLYECERRVFAELGGRPPPEFPLDLAMSALAMVLPLMYCGSAVRRGVYWLELPTSSSSSADAGDLADLNRFIGFQSFVFVISLLPLILVRFGWLCRTWRRRRLGRTGPYMPYEVRIRSGRAVANVENPIGWRLLLFLSILSFFFLLILSVYLAGGEPIDMSILFVIPIALAPYLLVSLPWWYRINRELRDLDRSYDSKQASSHPLGSLLMVALGWPILLPPFIAVFRIVRNIQRAQARVAGPVTMWSPYILTPGLLFPPALFAYLQHELNKVWAVEGEPLDPWPAGTSRDASPSTGTLPWLKAPNGRTTQRSVAWRASTPAWNHLNGSGDGADGGGELACREHLDPPKSVDKTVIVGEVGG